MMTRLLLPAVSTAALLLTGCTNAGPPAEDLMGKSELNAKGDALIGRGENAKLEAMNLPQEFFRRSGPNKAVQVRQAEDMIQHGRALKARAATMPASE